MTIIGSRTTPLTLSASAPNVTLTGVINAYGSLAHSVTYSANGTPGVFTLHGAAIGFGPTAFNITNLGVLETDGASSLAIALALGAPSDVTNAGTSAGGTGILIGGYGDATASTVTNTGLINGRNGVGVYLYGEGLVSNRKEILGGEIGIYLRGGGAVSNKGTVIGGVAIATGLYGNTNTDNIYNAGLVIGTGLAGIGASGTVINAASGYIRATDAAIVMSAGLTSYNPSKVVNDGAINGGAVGILFSAGGHLYNSGAINGVFGIDAAATTLPVALHVRNESTARLTGAETGIAVFTTGYIYNDGYIEGAAGIGTHVSNSNPMAYVASNDGVYLYAGDIHNAGTINGGASGVYLGRDAQLTNTSFIEAAGIGVTDQKSGGVTNHGLIQGGIEAVLEGGDAGLYNFGTLRGGHYGLNATGGLITNESGGQITGRIGVVLGAGAQMTNRGAILANPAYGTAAIGIEATGFGFNAGTISASGIGVLDLPGTGGIYNTGLITGGIFGAAAAHGGFIGNNGTIIGGAGTAISFAPGFENILELGPHSDIIGKIILNGGLELLGDPQHAGTLTLSQVQNLQVLELRASTVWDIPGTIEAGTVLLNEGTIFNRPGKALVINAATENDGLIAGATAINGSLTGAGTIEIATSAITINGAVASGQKFFFTSTAETLKLGKAGAFAGTIASFAQGDIIDLTGIPLSAITAKKFAHGTLTLTTTTGTDHLTFTNPAGFPHQSFALVTDGAGTAITLASTKPAAIPTTPGFLTPDWRQPAAPNPFVTLHA
jgi:hypothetical protein